MRSADVSPGLLRLLRDPNALPRPSPGDHAQALLRGHLLARIARAVRGEGLPVLLVKGTALALTIYPDVAARPMNDIDLLVKREARDRVVAALLREGGVLQAPAGRPWSADLLGETVVSLRAGAMSLLVEVHTTLDKLVPRPVDDGALFARARGAPGLPGLMIPSPVDHALLIAIHAAGHDFDHPIALLDIELLLRGGLDLGALSERARAWRLNTIMFILMRALRELGAASVTEEHVRAFDPGPARRAVIGDLPAPPSAASSGDLGLAWIVRQTRLRDDLGRWALGLLRYTSVRGVERLLFATERGPSGVR